MRPVQQPVGQVRLTNVAIVRYKRMGKRFEVAAYKNKVVNWRNRVETDINEVLQAHTVFMNVPRGIVAAKDDLREAFGSDDHLTCAKVILEKGELEVSDRERQLHYDTLFRDIATTIAEKCVNPETRRPYPVSIIERSLHEVHFAVIPTKPAKAQALKAIQSLKTYIPIERARMKVRVAVTLPLALAAPGHAALHAVAEADAADEEEDGEAGDGHAAPPSAVAAAAGASKPASGAAAQLSHPSKLTASGVPLAVKEWLASMHAVIEYEGRSDGSAPDDATTGTAAVEAIVDPGYFRRVEEEARRLFGGIDGSRCSVEVLSLSVITESSMGGLAQGGDDAAPTGGEKQPKKSALKKGGNSSKARSSRRGDDSDSDDDNAGSGVLGLPSKVSSMRVASDDEDEDETMDANGHDQGRPTAAAGQALATAPAIAAPVLSASSATAANDATMAAAKGTGMLVRRVTQPGQGRRLACNACATEFETSDEHRAHHKSEWHRFNLKRKVKAMEPMSKDGFDGMPAKERDAFLAMDV